MAAKVLVTGATGFLGARLARALLERGERVRVLARPGTSHRALAGLDVEIAEGDIRIEHTVYRALAGCDRMYHCAAVFALWADDPQSILEGACVGTESVLRAALARRLERVVYTSTAYTIGGTRDAVDVNEAHPWTEPSGPVYAIAKRRAEEFALAFTRERGLPVVAVNPASIYGPGDWKPTPTGQSVLEVLRAPALPWLGTLVPKPPGGLNVVDVDDVARGHMLAMDRGRAGERYILGGENVSMGDLFGTIAELVGKPVPALRVGRGAALIGGAMFSALAAITGNTPAVSLDVVRGSFGYYYWVSSEKAATELGYKSRPAKQTLARAVRFFVDNDFIARRAQRKFRLDTNVMAAV